MMTNAVNPVRSEEGGLALLTARCDTGSYDHENNDATARRDLSAVLGRLSAVQRGAGFGVENKQRDADQVPGELSPMGLPDHGVRHELQPGDVDGPPHVRQRVRES